MTSLIKCPQVLSVDYLQMTACYTGPYTHWRTSSSCSVILMHFRGGRSCGVCGSIRRSATSCTFAGLSPPKCPIFTNYVTQCCFLWRTLRTWESDSQRTSAGECRLMLLVKRQTPGCTSSSGTSRAPQVLQGAGFPGTCEIRFRLLLHLWDPHHKRDINRLEMVNRRGACVVFNKSWRGRSASPAAMVGLLRWSDLTAQGRKAGLVMTYKIKHGLVAIPSSRFAPRSDRLMRHNHDQNIGSTRSSHNTPKNVILDALCLTGSSSARKLSMPYHWRHLNTAWERLSTTLPSHLPSCALGHSASIPL